MKIILTSLWSFLDEFSGVVGSIVILFSISKLAIDRFSLLSIPLKMATSVMFLLFVVLTWNKIWHFIKFVNRKSLEIKVKHDFNSLPDGKPAKEYGLATTEKLKKWVTLTTIKAKDWSPDAQLTSRSLYYTAKVADYTITEHSAHLTYHSKLKQEIVTFYLSSDFKHYQESGEDFDPEQYLITSREIPFYELQPKWRKAMLQIIKSFEDKTNGSFEVAACNLSTGNIFITFSFYRGANRVESKTYFEFDGTSIIRKGKKYKLA
jgi:hypothetical protein